MKTFSSRFALGSLIVSSLILQGCTSDSADENATYQDISNQYNTTRVIYRSNPSNPTSEYYQPSYSNDQPTGYTRQPSDYNRPAVRYYSDPNSGYTPPPSSSGEIQIDNHNVPAAANSPDYSSVGAAQPVKRQSDLEWVNSQQSSGYTIEVGSDPKRSKVSYSVFKSPKSQRSAQFGYKNQDQKMYTGVYGTYKTKEEAEQALNALPPEVKSTATVQQWQNIQTKASKYDPEDRPSVDSPTVKDDSSTDWSKGNQ